MKIVTEKEVEEIVKKHFGKSLFVAVFPIFFVFLIGFYDDRATSLIPLVLPISTISAVSYFIRKILLEIYDFNKR